MFEIMVNFNFHCQVDKKIMASFKVPQGSTMQFQNAFIYYFNHLISVFILQIMVLGLSKKNF